MSAGVCTGTSGSFTILTGNAFTDGASPPSGKSEDRARGTLEMLDAAGVTVAATPLPHNQCWGVL